MASVQVLVRFRVLKCPPKYPYYNIRRGKYQKKSWRYGYLPCMHILFLEFYRGPRVALPVAQES